MSFFSLRKDMLRKVFLSSSLPESSLISPKQLPDIRQSLDAYNNELKQYKRVPPALRPHPLDKYGGGARPNGEGGETLQQIDRELELDEVKEDDPTYVDGEETHEDVSIRYADELETIPLSWRSNARRILPHLITKELGGLALEDVLYDVSVKNVKKIRSDDVAALSSVYRQLNGDSRIKKTWIARKLNDWEIQRALLKVSTDAARKMGDCLKIHPPGRKNYPAGASNLEGEIMKRGEYSALRRGVGEMSGFGDALSTPIYGGLPPFSLPMTVSPIKEAGGFHTPNLTPQPSPRKTKATKKLQRLREGQLASNSKRKSKAEKRRAAKKTSPNWD